MQSSAACHRRNVGVEVEQDPSSTDFELEGGQRRLPTGAISKEVWSFLISLFDGP
jgi:hypothetical protein